MKFAPTNFDLIDIKYEISILKKQLNTICEEYQNQKEQSKRATDKEIKKSVFNPKSQSDEAEYWYLVDEHRHLINDVLPRILINPFVVSLWSLYETAIIDLADSIKKKEGTELYLHDINGSHFIARALKYYKHVLNFPLNISDQLLKDLKIISSLRNRVAHSNSRMKALSTSLKTDLEEGQINGVEISRMGDFFLLKPSFAQWSFDLIEDHLNVVMNEYEKKYY